MRTRAVSAALYNMFVQGGNIVAVNIYRDDDKPLCEFCFCFCLSFRFTVSGIDSWV